MSNIKYIKPYKKSYSSQFSLIASLSKEGMTRVPGTTVAIFPVQRPNGDVETGMNENSIKLRTIKDPEARASALESAKLKRELLESKLNIDLRSNSEFWLEKAKTPFYLKDGDNVFNLDDPKDELEFSWLAEHPRVASSLEKIQSGEIDPHSIDWYIYEPDLETINEFNRNKKINDVVSILNKLGESEIRKVAYVLNLKPSVKAKYSDIYNLLNDYIKSSKNHNTSDPIEEFTKVANFTSETLAIKTLVKQLFDNKFIKARGNSIYEGDNLVAKSEADFELKLAEDKNLFNTYNDKLEIKKSYLNSI